MSVVLLDLEYTAWEGSLGRKWSEPHEHMEIVQIGAIRLDCATLKEQSSFEALVRPRINPVLSDYFVSLTGITNEQLGAHGVDFEAAHRLFKTFRGEDEVYAFGRDDNVWQVNVDLYGLDRDVFSFEVNDIRGWFETAGTKIGSVTSGEVARHIGADFDGSAHQAVSDVRSVAAGIRHLVAQGAANPFAVAQ